MNTRQVMDHTRDSNSHNSESVNTIARHKSRCRSDFIYSAIILNQNFDNYDQCQEEYPLEGISFLNVLQYINTEGYLINHNMMFFEIMSSF